MKKGIFFREMEKCKLSKEDENGCNKDLSLHKWAFQRDIEPKSPYTKEETLITINP